ncbi:hypothetical protein PBNK5_18900 [Pectobacterium brasiliense]
MLRSHDLNATQYITLCWMYLKQHGRPPFITDTRIFTAADLTVIIAGQFAEARDQALKIRDMLQSDATPYLDFAAEKLALTRRISDIQHNGWRLESMADDGGSVGAARLMLPRINYYLAGCEFTLSGVTAQLPAPVQVVNDFQISLVAFEKQLALMQSVLRDAGLLPRPEPAREFVYRGENVTVSVVQPEDYQHGAWLVRMQTKSLERENALEDAALTFPVLEGRVFLPGTVYGKSVHDSRSRQYQLGFTFHSGVSEFHMYTNGHEEQANPTSPDMLASCLSDSVDGYLLGLMKSMSGNQP